MFEVSKWGRLKKKKKLRGGTTRGGFCFETGEILTVWEQLSHMGKRQVQDKHRNKEGVERR